MKPEAGVLVFLRDEDVNPPDVAERDGENAAAGAQCRTTEYLRMLTLNERDRLLHRQGEVCRELEALRHDTFCTGDEAPLLLEKDLSIEVDGIEKALAKDRWWDWGGQK